MAMLRSWKFWSGVALAGAAAVTGYTIYQRRTRAAADESQLPAAQAGGEVSRQFAEEEEKELVTA